MQCFHLAATSWLHTEHTISRPEQGQCIHDRGWQARLDQQYRIRWQISLLNPIESREFLTQPMRIVVVRPSEETDCIGNPNRLGFSAVEHATTSIIELKPVLFIPSVIRPSEIIVDAIADVFTIFNITNTRHTSNQTHILETPAVLSQRNLSSSTHALRQREIHHFQHWW